MLTTESKKAIWRITSWASTVASGVVIFLAFFIRNPNASDCNVAVFCALESFFESWAPEIGGACALVLLGSFVIKERAKNPWALECIENAFGYLRQDCFTEECNDDDTHHHRVTLFRRRLFWQPLKNPTRVWRDGNRPWSGWLVPVARSGHTTQKSRTIFLAPDDPEHSEGVAGRVWSKSKVVFVSGLPSLTKSSSSDEIHSYSDATRTSRAFLDPRLYSSRKLSRSLLGFPVKYRGQFWGVVVMDSARADGIKPPDQIYSNIEFAEELFGPLSKQL